MSEYTFDFFDEKGKVVCQVCGKSYLVISPKHLGTHNVTHPEYKLRYPDAPLSCEEFNVKGRYGKEKQIFVSTELKKMDEVDDMPEHEVDPIIDEEIDFKQILEDNSIQVKDICASSKDTILDYLKSFFTNIKKDYMIQVCKPDKRLEFEFITDFTDPILKINVEFPKTFWHNRMMYDDPTRDQKLKAHGWKVIKIDSQTPTLEKIRNAIESS